MHRGDTGPPSKTHPAPESLHKILHTAAPAWGSLRGALHFMVIRAGESNASAGASRGRLVRGSA